MPKAEKGTRTKTPRKGKAAAAEEAPTKDRDVPGRCKNCGRENTLATRISCTECGFTEPA